MEQFTFRDKIIALQKEFLRDRYNSNRSTDFWYVMDSIEDELVLKWAERALKIKSPINEPWDSKEFLQLSNIIQYMRNLDRKTQYPYTKTQKRFCIFMIIKFWDDLEMHFYC